MNNFSSSNKTHYIFNSCRLLFYLITQILLYRLFFTRILLWIMPDKTEHHYCPLHIKNSFDIKYWKRTWQFQHCSRLLWFLPLKVIYFISPIPYLGCEFTLALNKCNLQHHTKDIPEKCLKAFKRSWRKKHTPFFKNNFMLCVPLQQRGRFHFLKSSSK